LNRDFRFILWSVLTYDFQKGISTEKCLQLAVSHTKPGSVVVFHDSLKAEERVLKVLPRFLRHFGDQGYRFDAITGG
jgi:hypothetical protein